MASPIAITVEDHAQSLVPATPDEVLGAIRESHRGLTSKALAKVMSKPAREINPVLKTLVSQGKIIKSKTTFTVPEQADTRKTAPSASHLPPNDASMASAFIGPLPSRIQSRFHRQTDHTPGTGNALQCCVASILRVASLDLVPNFIASPNPYGELRAFLAPRGLGFLKVELTESGRVPFYPGACEAIIAGPSPRGEFKHAVVGKFEREDTLPVLVFDPHQSDAFFAGRPAVWAGLFVCLRPGELPG